MFTAVMEEDHLIKSENALFDIFVANDMFEDVSASLKDSNTPNVAVNIDEKNISDALEYWYKKGSLEVKHFNKPELIARIAVEKDGILFSRSRILDGQRFVMAGGFSRDSLGLEVSLNLMTPVLDRHSPISYSVASYIHHIVGKHAGYETTYRLSLGFCHIIQGASLFRMIGEECSRCAMLRKKYIECVMGPVSDHQLTICSAFYAAFCDLDGPYHVYVPGHERATRFRKEISAKNWIMTFVCPVTKLVNLQVIETKSAEGVLEALTRFGCENGFPNFLLLDQESSFMKAVKEAEIDLKDVNLRCFKERGIRCEVAPVSGHNFTGLVERKIRTAQEVFEKVGLKNKRLHSTGLQTVAKLVENEMNNLPLGFSYGRDADNTPLLKMITPNMMRIGRLHSRVLDGPVRFPSGPKDIMKKVEEIFDAFFKLWNVTMVPRLVPQPKWFKDSPEVKPDDVVYFQKDESDLSSKWTVGQVDSVTRSKDGVVRRASVRYHNAAESGPRLSDRAVRSLVRLFNVEDTYFIDDMSEFEKLMAELEKKSEKVDPVKLVKGSDGLFKVKDPVANPVELSCGCCCASHCALNVHNVAGSVIGVNLAHKVNIAASMEEFEFPHIYERDLFDDFEDVPIKSGCNMAEGKDELFDFITAMETDFGLDA
jgi:hypothetical protein